MYERYIEHSDPLAHSSPLIESAKNALVQLPLTRMRESGIWRDRSTYFLNISYPSLQAMNEVPAATILNETSSQSGKTVALYVHVPFCKAECYYCHYYKQFGKSEEDVDAFLSALTQELTMQERQYGGLNAASIYIGGGTPSYLNSEQIEYLFQSIEAHVSIPKGIEISFEMHPESVTEDRLEALSRHNVNRINMGIESFDDTLLASENRRHSSDEAIDAYHRLKLAGFPTINLDLIYGLQGQTVQQWEQSLDTLALLQPDSSTMYYLRLKKGTPEYKIWKAHPERFASDEDLLLMHAMTFERMETGLGYVQNPVDWFIRDPSYFHVYQDHNWRKTDETELLGLGPSAYSYVGGWQYYNINDTDRWKTCLHAGQSPIWKGERLSKEESMRRTVMLGMKIGIDREAFLRTYQQDVIDAFPDTWKHLEHLQLVEISSEAASLTYMGKLFADEVGQQFYSDDMKRRMAVIDPAMVSTTWPQFNP